MADGGGNVDLINVMGQSLKYGGVKILFYSFESCGVIKLLLIVMSGQPINWKFFAVLEILIRKLLFFT